MMPPNYRTVPLSGRSCPSAGNNARSPCAATHPAPRLQIRLLFRLRPIPDCRAQLPKFNIIRRVVNLAALAIPLQPRFERHANHHNPPLASFRLCPTSNGFCCPSNLPAPTTAVPPQMAAVRQIGTAPHMAPDAHSRIFPPRAAAQHIRIPAAPLVPGRHPPSALRFRPRNTDY